MRGEWVWGIYPSSFLFAGLPFIGFVPLLQVTTPRAALCDNYSLSLGVLVTLSFPSVQGVAITPNSSWH